VISDTKIAQAAEQLRAIFRRMIEDGAGGHEIYQAILQALWAIGRDTSIAYAAGIAGELANRIQGAIAALKGKQP
jgi:hypothetical protein